MIQSPRTAVRIFGIIFTATMLSAVVGAGLFNYLIDPYAVFGTRTLAGVNVIKPRPDVMLSDIKLIVGARFRPNALILGNSRAEVGFDPGHPILLARGLRGYNAAIPGSGLDDAAHAFKLFATTNRIKVAVLGIDFLDFPEEPAESWTAPGPRPSMSTAKTRLLALFSTTALWDSIRTLLIQGKQSPAVLLANGFNPMFDYREIAANEGYPTLFRQRAQEQARTLARKPHNLYVGGKRVSPSFSALQALVRTAGEKETDLQLVIYPVHLLLLLQIQEAGLWPLFEQWKADVAAISDDARRHGTRITLWDFGCPDAFTTEAVPPDGDRETKMQWYWEAGHFKKELGDRVLARIFGQVQPESTDGFGFELTAANVDARNGMCREALATMRERFPALADQAAKLSMSTSARY